MTTKEHLSLHDKQIAAIRGAIREGMQLVLADRRERAEMRKDMRQMERNLRKQEANIDKLIAALGHRNGGKA